MPRRVMRRARSTGQGRRAWGERARMTERPSASRRISPTLAGQAVQAALPQVDADPAEVLHHDCPGHHGVAALDQPGELASLVRSEPAVAHRDRVPRGVLEHHPDDEHRELEVGGRHREDLVGAHGGQVGAFDRQSEVLRGVVADHEQEVRVDVHQATGAGIERVVVAHAGMLPAPGGDGLPEAEPGEDGDKALAVATVHQQVEVVVAARGPGQHVVALPVAVPHRRREERLAQLEDQRQCARRGQPSARRSRSGLTCVVIVCHLLVWVAVAVGLVIVAPSVRVDGSERRRAGSVREVGGPALRAGSGPEAGVRRPPCATAPQPGSVRRPTRRRSASAGRVGPATASA